MSASRAAPSLIVYTYASCDTCRRATRWLKDRGHAFEERPIRATPPSPAELTRALLAVGGDRGRLFNRSGRDYREQKLGEILPGLSESEVIQRLAANGNLIKRPLLHSRQTVLVGFDETEWAEALG